jgi:exodeoxyribonuclease-3
MRLGYESVAVKQKAYNGVAILSRHPMEAIAKALVGDVWDVIHRARTSRRA